MAKIGTAHIEIKPVLSDEAVQGIGQRIEDEIAAAVQRGIARGLPPGATLPARWILDSETSTVTPVTIKVDGKEVHRAVVEENREQQRRTGENPLG